MSNNTNKSDCKAALIFLRKNYKLYNDKKIYLKGGFNYEIFCDLVYKRSSISSNI